LEDGDIHLGSGDAHRDARAPEPLPLEGPVMAIGLGVGEAAALEAEGGDEIVARPQLVLSFSGGRLDPEKLLSAKLSNGLHAV
jgi:hypothetical protein